MAQVRMMHRDVMHAAMAERGMAVAVMRISAMTKTTVMKVPAEASTVKTSAMKAATEASTVEASAAMTGECQSGGAQKNCRRHCGGVRCPMQCFSHVRTPVPGLALSSIKERA
jgi:hypothetical protein